MASTQYAGLIELRARTSPDGPEYNCPNCKCKRYSPCGCMKKQGKKEKAD